MAKRVELAFDERIAIHLFQQLTHINFILLGRIAVLRICGLLLQTQLRDLSVCLSVSRDCEPCKTVESFEMPVGMWTWVGQRNHVLDEVEIPPVKGQF